MQHPTLDHKPIVPVGCSDITGHAFNVDMFHWLHWQEVRQMDCSGLVAKRLGASFHDLFVNDGGLYNIIYFA